jgi:UDP-GlcNAc:undecaprenyl-phosphate GlcNAc-1-phosphate transferase
MSLALHYKEVLLPAAVSLAAALVLAPALIRLCTRLGWVDKPDERKQHVGHIPLAGGLTIACAAALAGLMFHPLLVDSHPFWVGAAMVFVIGFLDDRLPIRARYRFLVQAAAAALFVVASGANVNHLGELLGPFVLVLGVFGIPFAVIGIAGLTNAINMMDGLDGLAAGLMLVALGWLLVGFVLVAGDATSISVVLEEEVGRAMQVTSLLIGALLGFLVFSQRAPWRKRAAMFLGDGGSMSLGFAVGALAIYASSAFGSLSMPAVTAVWIAAVPLVDMFASMLRRMLAGLTPMTPDRKHVHHLLIELGLSPGRAVVVLQAVGLAAGLVGVAGWRLGVPDYWMFWGIVAVFGVYFVLSQRIWKQRESSQAPVLPDAALMPRASPSSAKPRPIADA